MKGVVPRHANRRHPAAAREPDAVRATRGSTAARRRGRAARRAGAARQDQAADAAAGGGARAGEGRRARRRLRRVGTVRPTPSARARSRELEPLGARPADRRRSASRPTGLWSAMLRAVRERGRGRAARRPSCARADVRDVSVVDTGRGQLDGGRSASSAPRTRRRCARRTSSRARASSAPRSPPRAAGGAQTMLVVRDPPANAVAKLRELQAAYPGTEIRVGGCDVRDEADPAVDARGAGRRGAARARRVRADEAVAQRGRRRRALETASGNVYTGINLDLACGIGFCAEHSAVAEMLKARETVDPAHRRDQRRAHRRALRALPRADRAGRSAATSIAKCCCPTTRSARMARAPAERVARAACSRAIDATTPVADPARASGARDIALARALFEEYAAWLGDRPVLPGLRTRSSRRCRARTRRRAAGCSLAGAAGEALGCIALRPLDPRRRRSARARAVRGEAAVRAAARRAARALGAALASAIVDARGDRLPRAQARHARRGCATRARCTRASASSRARRTTTTRSRDIVYMRLIATRLSDVRASTPMHAEGHRRARRRARGDARRRGRHGRRRARPTSIPSSRGARSRSAASLTGARSSRSAIVAAARLGDATALLAVARDGDARSARWRRARRDLRPGVRAAVPARRRAPRSRCASTRKRSSSSAQLFAHAAAARHPRAGQRASSTAS